MPVCPYCAEPIGPHLERCPYCQSDLNEPRAFRSEHTGAESVGMRMLLPVGRSGLAIAAGYLGLISILLIPAPIALAVSILALIDLRKNPELHGMGRAIFGIISGTLCSILLVVVVVMINLN